MPANSWLAHVKAVHAKGSTSFKESLKRASASWKKTKGAAPKKGKKKVVEEVVEEEAPKKKRRRRRAGPKIPAKGYKDVDSRNL